MSGGFLIRKLLFGIVALAVLVVVGGVVLLVTLDRIVAAGIERGGPLITRVPMEVSDVDISLLRGSFALHGFTMGNPEGFSSERSVYVGRVQVDAELGTLLSDEIVLPLIDVENPEITVEFGQGGTNLGRILEEVERPEKRTGKKMRIGVLRIREPAVAVGGLPAGQTVRLNLPDIELEDLSAGGEARSPSEIVADILAAVRERVLEAVQERLPVGQLEELREQLGGAAEEGTRALEEARKALEESAGGLLDVLKRKED
ncbi:MAG: hypothetical protein PVJ27_11570 [Candidatus Brocadiaceae bacterium]|jgi:hypothetical protein